MASCAFVGDCIALGLALAAPASCDVRAKMGWAPATIAAHAPADAYRWAVISAGSNPGCCLPTIDTLRALRGRIRADRVVWVLPAAPARAAIVRRAAAAHGDAVVALGRTARDGVHPRSYAALWSAVAWALKVLA